MLLTYNGTKELWDFLSLSNLFYEILGLELIVGKYFVQGAVLNTLCLLLTVSPNGRHYIWQVRHMEIKVFAEGCTAGKLAGLDLNAGDGVLGPCSSASCNITSLGPSKVHSWSFSYKKKPFFFISVYYVTTQTKGTNTGTYLLYFSN